MMRRADSRMVAIWCALGLAILLYATPADAQVYQWSSNGHSYELVDDATTWEQAKVAAEARGGHLATVTSAAENLWITSKWGSGLIQHWIGGYQPPGFPEPDGGWSWVTGEPFVFTNWYPLGVPDPFGEPNNFNGVEAELAYNHVEIVNGWGWNDLDGTTVRSGYLVEYEAGETIFRSDFETGQLCDWSVVSPPISIDCQITITLPAGVTLDLAYIPAGTFMMGSPADERGRNNDREDLHEVTLTQGYYMGVTEVTQGQWEAVTGTAMPTSCGSYGIGPDYPVYCVSWDDIAGVGGFVDQLNAHLVSTSQPGAGLYRLPTDAEWERAARAGNQYRFSHGDVLGCDDVCGRCATHDEYMWWCGNDNNQSELVGSKLANGFVLYDMHGSLYTWVQDWHTDHLGYEPQTDPTGPASGTHRVMRGGDWGYEARYCRSASRVRNLPSLRYKAIGLRLVRSE